MIRSLALAIAVSLSLGSPTLAQDGERQRRAREYTAEQIDKLIARARTGSAVIRPQAAARLVLVGERAAERLVEISGDSNVQLAALGTALVEIFGQFGDDRLRDRLWPALEDSEFPWRPAASRSLAGVPTDGEWRRFERFLDDPIAPVRFACLDALATLSDRGSAERKTAFLRHAAAQLGDESDVVRRNAALHLDARGQGRALLWLYEDLKRTDTFLGVPTGEAARYATMYAMDERTIEVGKYNAANPESDESVEALASLEKRLLARAAEMESKLPEAQRALVPRSVPSIARAGAPVEGAVLGVQLRSCRRGDFYLRWTDDDVLIVGFGNPARIPLAEGSTKRLLALAERTQEATSGQFYWGRPGCDMEMFSMPRKGQPDEEPLQLILSKDEQPTENLRPRSMTELGAAMAASIPTNDALDQSDPRTRALAARVRSAFASIGGPVVAR